MWHLGAPRLDPPPQPSPKTEVDYLLARLARVDKRAQLKPGLARAS